MRALGYTLCLVIFIVLAVPLAYVLEFVLLYDNAIHGDRLADIIGHAIPIVAVAGFAAGVVAIWWNVRPRPPHIAP